MKQLAIVGFGLVGASLAAAVRAADSAIEIVAVDRAEVVTSAAARRLADELVDVADRAHVVAIAEHADICVLSAPVRVIAAELPALLERARIVTDCGSTKRAICAAVAGAPRRGRFVPGHPMAGGPEGGADHARADLFRDQTWLLCPELSDADAVESVEALIALTGATIAHLETEAHDHAVAYTSHAPQIMASALAVLSANADAVVAAGPAYRATTRSAGGAEAMWRDIFATNADEISAALRQISSELAGAAAGLASSPPDSGAALALLQRARALR
ncbi:MAG TPA: prephenate dehydrogenase/arogenate dehydrogenase family protein [Polyangiaceae bacterium]|jgi:prephenate dehydrogenase|nr:prephenate dehydrogenase/arogenate dehydrogenase family protein [Polyangiaceae bacterium]